MYEMKSTVTVPENDMVVAKRFSECCYWDEEAADLLREDFVLDIPYAPPGMYQHLTLSERKFHFDWMRRVTSNWKWSDIIVVGTDVEDIFWVFRHGEADTEFGGVKGSYKSKFATMLRIKDSKIYYIKDHSNMIEYYRAIGVELPKFYYDAKPVDEYPDWVPQPDIDHTEESMKKQVEKTLSFFVDPNFWDPEINTLLANDFVHELPFAPDNMRQVYPGKVYDSLNEWLDRHLTGGGVADPVFYNTTDPYIYVAEYNCLFETNWGYTDEEIAAGKHGIYPNREISFIELDKNGRCRRLDEYFNSFSKFLSCGKPIPTFPYLYI